MTKKREQQLRLVIELFVLLGAIPTLIALSPPLYTVRHLILIGGCLFIVWRLHGLVCWKQLFAPPPRLWWQWPLYRGIAVFAGALLFTLVTQPENLFLLPRQRPLLWLAIVALYPLLSVLPQEIIYRVYIFERHKLLWPAPLFPIIVSALLFSWVHIIYAGTFALCSTLLGGLSLGILYSIHRTAPGVLWVLLLEHALYGLAMFTSGLGHYFYFAR